MVSLIRPIILATFSVLFVWGGYHRWRAESGEPINRRAEGWGLLLGIRLVALVLFVVIARWARNPDLLIAARFPVPEFGRWLGVAMLVGAAAWLMWMFHTLGLNITDTVVTRRQAQFVRSGPYRFVRNPMYVGLLALFAGLGIAIGNWLPPLLGSVVFTLLAIRTRIEERYLLARFPHEYGQYMREVGRFWPKRWR